MKQTYAKLGFLILSPVILHLAVATIAGKSLPIRIYTSADGLGSSFVNYLASDSRGFMWFCTRDGLSRFDGFQFVTYRIGETDAPPGIESIFESSDGAYWITTTAGTYRFDPNRISAQNPTTPTIYAERVFVDRGAVFEAGGTLWLAADGLFRIEYRDDKAVAVAVDLGVPLAPGVGLNVGAVHEWPDGSLFVNTSAGLVRMLPSGQRVFYPDAELRSSPTSSVRMLADKRGLIWLTRSNKVYVFKPEAIESLSQTDQLITRAIVPTTIVDAMPGVAPPVPSAAGEVFEYRNPTLIGNRFAKEIAQTSDGTVWIAGEDVLLEFSAGGLKVHTNADGLPSVMGDIAEDRAGNLWIAGQSGLARLNRNGMVGFGKEDGTGSDRILAVFPGPKGVMHISTTDSNVAAFDGTRFKNVRPGISGNTEHLWTSRIAMGDSRGDWWILTSNKLYRFSGDGNIESLAGRKPSGIFGRAEGLTSDGIFQIFEDSRGDVWVSTRGTDPALNGMSRLRAGDTRFQPFSERDGLPSRKSAASFAEDRDGNVWIALFEGGVLRYDGEIFHELKYDPNLLPATSVITDIHFDLHGRLWITSASAGAIQVNNPGSGNPNFIRHTNTTGLSSNNVRTVTEDRFGRIYFGTARGVDRLSPDTGRVRQFSVADGLPADFVSDSNRDSEGNVWFATNGGVARLVPVPDEQANLPSIWLGAMRIAGDQHPTPELGTAEIHIGELEDWQSNLQIEFFGIDFRPGEALRYQYKLDGLDSDWSPPDTDRSVTFANIRPGTYRFLVRGVDSAGTVSEKPAVVNFTILPPFWQRWWFLAIVAFAVAAAVMLLFRYRIANLRRVNLALSEAKLAEENLRKAREERLAEVESVRARIATDLHDDIGGSLTQIAILSEVAQAKAGAGNGAVAEPLSRITDVSNELVDTMSDIVWAINPAKDHLSDLTQRMRRVAADLLSPKGITVHFRSREEDRAVTIKTNARREVFLIFKESVNNIAKHSGAKNVRIDLEINRDQLLLKILDDGKGFVCGPPSFEDTFSSEGPSGNGIRNMRKRAAEMGGRFDIDSGPGRGTTTLLELPLEIGRVTEA